MGPKIAKQYIKIGKDIKNKRIFTMIEKNESHIELYSGQTRKYMEVPRLNT